jgi:hypothetical protein
MLLRDGSVLVHDADAVDWWKLTPDKKGSYITGTWTQVASTPSTYGPQYFGSAVLPDGRVVVIGGEYNLTNEEVWTNIGYIYDPVANTWTFLPPPTGWGQIGDAQSVVLPDGTFMLGYFNGKASATLNATTLAWTINNGSTKDDRMDEEGWTLLKDGTILTVDDESEPGSQRFLPSTGNWISANTVPVELPAFPSQELGPQMLGYDGKVFAVGATGNTAIYTPPTSLMDTGSWDPGPTFPQEPKSKEPYAEADGPGCVLPNGLMMLFASPGIFDAPAQFFTFNGTALTAVAGTPNTPTDSSYYGNMLLLPSGQMLFTDFSNDVELYTPAGGPQAAWRPTITSVPSGLAPSQSYVISGTQFNGLTQGSAYGDDFQNATNYPVVRITNNATGDVFYCRTTNPSTSGVATGTTAVSVHFLVPASIETGASTIEVVANGIPSLKTAITVGTTIAGLSLTHSAVIGGTSTPGTVSVSVKAGVSGDTITLSSSDPAHASVPASVKVLSGNTSVGFTVTTTSLTTSEVVTIKATFGSSTLTTPLTVQALISSLVLTPTSVIGGVSSDGVVRVSTAAGPSGDLINITSNNAAATAQAAVKIASSGTVASFPIKTTAVNVPTTVTIGVSFSGSTASQTLTVLPALSLVVKPLAVVGGTNSDGIITLAAPAPEGGAIVTISSSSKNAVVQAAVRVLAGALTAGFPINTLAVTKLTTVDIYVTYGGSTVAKGINLSPAG